MRYHETSFQAMNRGIPACDWILSADTYTQTWLHDCQRSAACLWVRGEAELWSAPQVAFERTFGAPVEQLAELVAKKEVTLPKLLALSHERLVRAHAILHIKH